MRAFIGLEVPEGTADEMAGVARQLSACMRGRFLPRSTYHVTLAFLGDVDEVESRRAMDALEAACMQAEPVELRFRGLGTFGKPHDATLWMGVEPASPLMQLAAGVRERLEREGVSFDEKPFKPHITIARRAALPKRELPPLLFPVPACAQNATLFKSTLTSEGTLYKPLFTVQLPA